MQAGEAREDSTASLWREIKGGERREGGFCTDLGTIEGKGGSTGMK